MTEHPIDEESGYLVLVNYSPRPQTAHITLDGITLSPFHNGELSDGSISMEADDGAVFTYRKAKK